MQYFRSRRKDITTHARITAIKRCDDTACSFDYRYVRLDIISLEPGIYCQIQITHCQHPIDVTITTIVCELYGIFKRVESRSL